MANWLGNLVDYAGTAVKAPELGISEFLGGGNSVYTGVTPQSQKAMFGGGYQYNPGGQAYSNANPNLNYNYKPGSILGAADVSKSYSPPSNSGGGGGNGAMTEQQALDAGKDINELRRQGLLIENSGGGVNISDQQNKVRSTIEGGFNDIFSNLDRMAGLLPEYQKQDEQYVNDQYGIEAKARQSELDANKAKIGGYRTDVGVRKAASMGELADNMRNMLKAGNTMLGAYGAGDSSAVGMYNYALAKQSDKQAASLGRQANDQLAQLDQKETDLKTTYDSAIASLDTWKNDSINKVRENARAALEQLNQQRMQYGGMKTQAMAQLETGILDYARQQLAQVETENRAYVRQASDWAKQRIAQLQDYKINLTKSADFSPQQLTSEAMQGLNGAQFQNNSDAFYNPYAMSQWKKKQTTV